MLQQLSGHRLEYMKEGDDDIWYSGQERPNILDNAMGVLGLVDGQKNSHRASLEVRIKRCSDLHIIPLEFHDSKRLPGQVQSQLPEANEEECESWKSRREIVSAMLGCKTRTSIRP
jgi:hypothetical protein